MASPSSFQITVSASGVFGYVPIRPYHQMDLNWHFLQTKLIYLDASLGSSQISREYDSSNRKEQKTPDLGLKMEADIYIYIIIYIIYYMPLEPCLIQLPPNSRSSTAFARRCPPGERGTFGSNASVVRPEGSTGNMSDVIEKNGSLPSFTLQKHVFFLHHVVHGITKGYLISCTVVLLHLFHLSSSH